MPTIDIFRLILAVVLSALLWFVIQVEANPERQDVTSFTIQVEVVNAPSGLQVTSDPAPVRVELRATEDVWRRLGPQSFRATADATRATEGTNNLAVRVEKLDQDVRGTPNAVPATVAVRLEKVEEKSVPVRVQLAGTVPFGYSFSTPQVQPGTVTVSGPSGAVDRVTSAVVDVSLEGITVTVNASYAPKPVDVSGQAVQNVIVSPPSVNVTIPVSQQVTYKQVGVRPVTSGVPAPGYYVQAVLADPSSVTVVGNPSSLSGVDFVETLPLDVSGATSAVAAQVDLSVPPGVSLLQQRPVTVTARIEPLQTAQTVRVPVEIVNLPASLTMQDTPGPVDVTISGQAPTLQNLNPRDFRASVNLNGLGPGTHDVKVTVSVPQALAVEKVNPETVRVTLLEPTPTPVPTATPTLPPTATPIATPIPPTATPRAPTVAASQVP